MLCFALLWLAGMNELLAPIYWVFAHDVDGAFQSARHFAT
jgi:hypothetical protein